MKVPYGAQRGLRLQPNAGEHAGSFSLAARLLLVSSRGLA